MQNLAARHEDRARRKAMNRAEGRILGGNPAASIGTAALAYRNFNELRVRLGDKELAELETAMQGIDAEFAGGSRSLAEAPDGSGDTMAGIGVVNANVVPAAVIAKSDEGSGASISKDPAWGDTKPVTVEPLKEVELDPGNNVNGQALVDQVGDISNAGGGWGTQPATGAQKADPLAAQTSDSDGTEASTSTSIASGENGGGGENES